MSIKNVISSDRHILPNGYNHHHHHENNDESGSKDSIIEEKKLQQSDNGVEQQRDQWGGQLEFLLACLGNAVGLGNCWRFPYLCYKNGGGAFLLPYLICCLIIGLPLFLIELGLGQFSAMGPGQLWANLSPLFRGVGLASIISSSIVAIYYNMIIAWTLFYFVQSFFGQNWQRCTNWFNTENCLSILDNDNNITNYRFNVSHTNAFVSSNHSISSTEEFFNNYVLIKSTGIDDMTQMNWKLVAALFISWCIVALALIKGIQSSGKVVYFTATFPYVILAILLARGLTLPGSYDGLRYYLMPNWNRISDVDVWRDAAVQVFYSFGIGGGGMITYASYNRFHNPVTKHALLVGFGDFATSLFCGAVVFTMIGYMASALNKPIEQIVQDGAGLAFIVIPEGLSRMPISLLWSVLFFTMLFLLGIDSQFAMVETVITYLFDDIRSKKIKVNKPLVVILTSFVWFILGLPLCTNAGIYIFTIMDEYSVGVPCLVIGLLEIFIVTYIYGIDIFFDNLEKMTKWKPKILLQSHLVIMITVIAPSVMLWILSKQLFETPALKYGSYQYPYWAIWIGWSFALLSISAIPLVMIKELLRILFCYGYSKKTINQRLRMLIRPTNEWWNNYHRMHGHDNDDTTMDNDIHNNNNNNNQTSSTDSFDLMIQSASNETINEISTKCKQPMNGRINHAAVTNDE
ncbi:LOW QUALITY PROTEIN: sodium- and chloride-dependent glycine transporter 1-like [Dermatophagoides pteronyssinus]|uniref:LOW QUALITY PROTEIN: sodium- and chloride-dependent glycine transporter 1-like n=1 Tax=Dermatophagoides pteronyssinus TaxID=6956 RepID=UPI003F67CA7B